MADGHVSENDLFFFKRWYPFNQLTVPHLSVATQQPFSQVNQSERGNFFDWDRLQFNIKRHHNKTVESHL